MMRRKSDRRKLIEKMSRLAKDIAKKRDSKICQKCGKPVTGVSCHGSHVIPVSGDHRLEFHPINIKVLCYHDHMNWWHKNPLEAGEWFEEKFPERTEWLRQRRIEHKSMGTIGSIWLEEWYGVLQEIYLMSPEEINEWQEGCIGEEVFVTL